MQITKERIVILCRMAYDGARDDGGREFANNMLFEYNKAWSEMDGQIASNSAKEKDSLLAKQKEELATNIRAEILQEMEERVRNAAAAQETELSSEPAKKSPNGKAEGIPVLPHKST